MLIHFGIFLVALVALAKGADLFVESSAKIAKRLGVSDLVIGLTITSIGTSVPELASSISASLNQAPELIVGNIVGSNIANIGLILGLSALLRSIQTDAKMHDRDGLIMIASTALFFLFSLDNRINEVESGIFLLLYLMYIFFVILSSVRDRAYHFRDFMKFVFDFEYVEPVKQSLKMNLPSLGRSYSTTG
ncbi:MAG TPA: sodium:proton exchanger, partial [Bdellovibrionales bacterium]|nr:sodium:proton exchanger [Bdellovibrionales bacterium]